MVSLRQESFGKEEETRTLKPFVETLRVRTPPGRAGPAARSESCVVLGQPILRSVDSELKGRVIEPRKYKPLGAFVMDTGGGRVGQLTDGPLSLPDPAGVEEHWRMIKRVPRELGRPCHLHRDCRLELRLTNSRMIHSFLAPSWWGRTGGKTVVSPSEAHEARRDGWQGVAAPHRSSEAGERPFGPGRAKGAPRCGLGVGTTPRTSCLTRVSPRNGPVVRGTAIPQRDEPDAFKGHVRICGGSRE